MARHPASGGVRCCARYLFISNIVTFFLPNTAPSLSSARISRRFSGFCSSCFLMWSQTLLTTSPRGWALLRPRRPAPSRAAGAFEARWASGLRRWPAPLCRFVPCLLWVLWMSWFLLVLWLLSVLWFLWVPWSAWLPSELLGPLSHP